MPVAKILCILCGAPIDESPHFPEWMGHYRAVYTVLEDWAEARISGVGKREPYDIIPLDGTINIDVSETTVDESWVRINFLKSTFGGKWPPNGPLLPVALWGFPLHDQCWHLLRATNSQIETKNGIQALFDVCRSQPTFLPALVWDHDYNGLFPYKVDPKELFPGELAQLQAHKVPSTDYSYRSDPMDILAIRQLVSRYSDDTIDAWSRTGQDAKLILKPIGNDPFRLLPPELLVNILIRSATTDVVNLRLASKWVANIGLPDSFWSSRFRSGREFAHMFELADGRTRRGRWRAIYLLANTLQSLPAIINRKRVWELACRISDLVAMKMESQVCHGSLCKSLFSPLGTQEFDGQRWLTAQSRVIIATERFNAGSRSLNDAAIAIPGPQSTAWASLVNLHGLTYVAGLRIVQPNGDGIRIGYQHPQREVEFTWCESNEEPRQLVGFQLAIDSRGIRGICMISAGGSHSRWVGDHEAIPKKSITWTEVQAIKAGFDALKMVSLSIHAPSLAETTEAASRNPDLGESALWFPEIPDSSLQLVGVTDERLVGCLRGMPFHACLFGGSDGRRLQHLARISIWIIDETDPNEYSPHTSLRCIEFHFDDGSPPIIVGRVPEATVPPRQRFDVALDSRNGERITGIDTWHDDPECVFAITLHTSFDRTVQVPPEFSPFVEMDQVFGENLQSQGTIVGFFFVLLHNVNFKTIGLVCSV